MPKFLCAEQYIEDPTEFKMVEADDERTAAAQFQAAQIEEMRREHDERQQRRKSARTPSRPFELNQSNVKPVVVINVEDGTVALWECKPPEPAPIEQWEWTSTLKSTLGGQSLADLEEEREFDGDDEDDEDDVEEGF